MAGDAYDKATWKASEEHEATKPLLTYEKGEPTTVSMDLVFDSTDTGFSVYDTYVIPLRDFLTSDVSVEVKGKNPGDPPKKTQRPPFCKFTWGSFEFDCVIDKVSCTFLMFKPDGTPLRAKVSVGLKENVRHQTGNVKQEVTLTAAGSIVSGSGTNATTYTSGPGDTSTSIAHRFHANPQHIALANNLVDPMDIRPGTKLVIPANAELAHVLARQSLRHTPAYWKNDRKVEPFQHREVKGGDRRYVPSAFEDEGPVALDYEVEPGSLATSYKSFGPGTTGKSALALGSSGQGIEYGEHADSDFAFGQTKPQTYGDHKDSALADSSGDGIDPAGIGESGAAGGSSGQGAGAGEAGPSAQATDVRNTATPDGEGPATQGQSTGGQGESDAAGGTSGQGAGAGGAAGSSSGATEYRDTATPDGEGPATQAQSTGGHGASDAAGGTSGQGAGAGGAAGSSSGATEFRDTATPDGEGPATQAQSTGGHGASDAAGGTSGQGAGSGGGHGSSDGAASYDDKATPIAQGAEGQGLSYGGQGPSDAASTQGNGAGGSSGGGASDAASTQGNGAGGSSGSGASDAASTQGNGAGGSSGNNGAGGSGGVSAGQAGTIATSVGQSATVGSNPDSVGTSGSVSTAATTASVQGVLRGASNTPVSPPSASTPGATTAGPSSSPAVTPATDVGTSGPTLSAAEVFQKGKEAADKGSGGEKK